VVTEIERDTHTQTNPVKTYSLAFAGIMMNYRLDTEHFVGPGRTITVRCVP